MRANFFLSDLVNLLPLLLFVFWAVFGKEIWPLALLFAVGGPLVMWANARWRKSESLPLFAMLVLRHHAYALGLVVGAFQNAPLRSTTVSVKRAPW